MKAAEDSAESGARPTTAVVSLSPVGMPYQPRRLHMMHDGARLGILCTGDDQQADGGERQGEGERTALCCIDDAKRCRSGREERPESGKGLA